MHNLRNNYYTSMAMSKTSLVLASVWLKTFLVRIMCKYQLLWTYINRVLRKRSSIVIAVTWCLLLLFLSWRDTKKEIGENEHYDILINSYMRSGSSFTGQLLAFNPDTFYWYEPVWSNHGLMYFMGRYACIGDNHCGDFGKGRIEEVNTLLQNIYSCELSSASAAMAESITPYHSGPNWKPYLKCRDQNKTVESCLTIMEDVCKQSKHRATKIVRLTVDNLEHILENQPNVKAIHLIRDPRAIINSKITTKWYKFRDSEENIKSDVHDVCSRMKYDLSKGEELKKKYPRRFAFVFYEDLHTDLQIKSEMLYSYFGIDKYGIESAIHNIQSSLKEEHIVNKTEGDYTNWWRFQLSFRTTKLIDSVCGNVLSFLGYKQFLSESELRNLTIKAFSLNEELLIEALNKDNSYDFESLHQQRPYIRKIDIIPEHGTRITKHRKLLI